MAELSKDIVLSMTFDYVEEGDRRVAERLLSGAREVTAFRFVDDGTLVVSAHAELGADRVAQALQTAGLYPRETKTLGIADEWSGNAC